MDGQTTDYLKISLDLLAQVDRAKNKKKKKKRTCTIDVGTIFTSKR